MGLFSAFRSTSPVAGDFKKKFTETCRFLIDVSYEPSKLMFGIFPVHAVVEHDMLLKGMDDVFYIPNSRHTRVDEDAVRKCKDIKILAESDISGIAICKTHDNKSFFFTGHSEYDRETLKREYLRDKNKGLNIEEPVNYFVDGNLDNINMSWKSTANLLFYNWLNYYVYQVTPFEL